MNIGVYRIHAYLEEMHIGTTTVPVLKLVNNYVDVQMSNANSTQV